MTDQEFAAWGKFDRTTGRIHRLETTGRIHRLEHHCADVAAVFEALLDDRVLRERFRVAAGGALPAITIERLKVLAFLHDFGKLNSLFQFKVRDPSLHADRKWKRQGREWRGPCPVTGAGTDTAYAKEADRITNGILLGCHRCHPFDRQAFIDHLNALMPGRTRRPAAGYGGPPAKPRPGKPPPKTGAASRPRRSRLHERIWRAGVPPAGTPAERYLVDRRACWRPGDVLPPSIRWLPAASPAWKMLRPAGPPGAAGAVLYAFIGAVDRRLGAVQAEGLDGDGNRQEWARRLKRVSIAGSQFEHGAQRFEAIYRGPKAPASLGLIERRSCGPMRRDWSRRHAVGARLGSRRCASHAGPV